MEFNASVLSCANLEHVGDENAADLDDYLSTVFFFVLGLLEITFLLLIVQDLSKPISEVYSIILPRMLASSRLPITLPLCSAVI